jgi:urease accessory protein
VTRRPSTPLPALLQLADSALPVGRFAHSYGLEALLTDDSGADADSIAELVETAVREGVGPLDGVATAWAHASATEAELRALDARVTARKLTPAARISSTMCGGRLAVLVPDLTTAEPATSYAGTVCAGLADGNFAVVLGALAAGLGLTAEEAVLVELRGAASGLLSAAVRLGRLSARQAQAAERSLAPALVEACAEAVRLPLDAMRSSALELEVHAIRHARADARLFIT